MAIKRSIAKLYDQAGEWIGVEIVEIMSQKELEKRYPTLDKKLCPSCRRLVKKIELEDRICAYQEEINDIEVTENICNACEKEHQMDI